jgi:SAM-dependent methyltransferase
LNSPDALPFQRCFFDIAVCQEVVEHVENPWELLRRIGGVLADGGFLLLSTPNIASEWSRRLFLASGYFHWFTPDRFSFHINAVPFWEVELIARGVGFTPLRMRGNGEYYFPGPPVSPEVTIKRNEEILFVLQKSRGHA